MNQRPIEDQEAIEGIDSHLTTDDRTLLRMYKNNILCKKSKIVNKSLHFIITGSTKLYKKKIRVQVSSLCLFYFTMQHFSVTSP